MKYANFNKEIVKKIALALGELNEQVIFVGGATVGFYINDPAADDLRPTKDVDISLSIASIVELENVRERLSQKGFIQTADDNVICRFRYDYVKVDVMNTKAIGWAPANPWFEAGFEHKLRLTIDDLHIFIIPLSFFLATKFAAYNSRGNHEPRTSHDFEDIVYVLDNRTDLVEEIFSANEDVKIYLKKEFEGILKDGVKLEAVLCHLVYESREERYKMILEKLNQIVNGK